MIFGIDASRLQVAQRTGTEQYTWELLQALGAINTHHTYQLYTNGLPAALPPLPPNFRLRSIPLPRLWTHLRLSAEMLLHPPDLLFVPAHVLPVWSPQQAVVTIHDLGYIYYPEAHPLSRRLYLRLSTRWNARRATHIIADSATTQQDIVRHCRVPESKISVVHLGVGARFRPIRDRGLLDTVAQRYGISTPYLLFVGTIQPRKNLARLIEAWAAYTRQNANNTTLVIAGKSGWITTAIERRAYELGIAERVRFTGYVADDDLPPLISGALGYVFPSLYEGFGLPVLEAQACGTPVLTSTVSSLPEVAGDAAIFVDPHSVSSITDGIGGLCEDQQLRERLRDAGLRRIPDWSWQRTAQATLRILEATTERTP